MLESLTSLLLTLNSLSPLAVIGLLGVVIFMMVKGKKDVESHVHQLKTNDLHELPTMAEDLRSIAASLHRIEVRMGEDFTYLKARLNGKS